MLPYGNTRPLKYLLKDITLKRNYLIFILNLINTFWFIYFEKYTATGEILSISHKLIDGFF